MLRAALRLRFDIKCAAGSGAMAHLPLVLLDAVHQEHHGAEHGRARRSENSGAHHARESGGSMAAGYCRMRQKDAAAALTELAAVTRRLGSAATVEAAARACRDADGRVT